jgi:hypothetical protein
MNLSGCFAAIRFVLNDAFASAGQEERQKLLHVSVNRYLLLQLHSMLASAMAAH